MANEWAWRGGFVGKLSHRFILTETEFAVDTSTCSGPDQWK